MTSIDNKNEFYLADFSDMCKSESTKISVICGELNSLTKTELQNQDR
jgi:hypothetical protein